jgi:hypothetical protein
MPDAALAVPPAGLAVRACRNGTSRTIALVLFTAVSSAGCHDGSGGAPSVLTQADTIDGAVHIRNSGEAARWTATPVLRIGSVAGGDAEFGRLRSLIADAQGNIYVADVQAQQILVFNAAGERTGSMGRSGGGPGEFRSLYSLAWLDGRLAALDPGNVRISVFTSGGEVAHEMQYYPMTGPVIRMHTLRDDGFYVPVRPSGGGGLTYVRFTASGAADTIPAPRAPENVPGNSMRCDRPDGGITFISVPEGPTTVFGFPPGGGTVAAAWTESYRIAFIDASGDTLRTVTRERPPVAFPDSIWERAQEPLRELRTQFPGSLSCEPAALTRPQARAAFRSLIFDEAGRLWV